jgi:hypothetical protein
MHMTLRRSLVLISLFSVGINAVRLAIGFTVAPEHPYESSTLFWLAWLGTTALAAHFLVVRGSVQHGHGSWRALGWHGDGLLRNLALGGATGAVSIAIVIIASLLVGATLEDDLELISSYAPSQRAVFVAIGLQPLLVARWGRVGGLLATAAIFSAYHLDPRPISLATKFLAGLVYGLARELGHGALLAPAFAHFLVWAVVGSF